MSDPNFYPKVQQYNYSSGTNPDTPSGATKSLGIFCSDIVIRTGIMAAFQELRANPHLLDYVFAGIPQDGLTSNEYGISEKDQAKKWFLENEIHVMMNYNFVRAPKFPCITISLSESTQVDPTLGDVNYETTDIVQGNSVSYVLGPISAQSYDSTTGKLVISNPENVELFTGMYVFDKDTNKYYQINNLDSNTVLYLSTNIQSTFKNVLIVPQDQFYRVPLESTTVRETYRIGCHVVGQPVYLQYLYSIFVFFLLWGKQKFLEARGFERSTYSSSDLAPEAEMGAELLFSRYTQLTGFVRHFWPKGAYGPISGIGTGPIVHVLEAPKSPPSIDTNNQLWDMELDKPSF